MNKRNQPKYHINVGKIMKIYQKVLSGQAIFLQWLNSIETCQKYTSAVAAYANNLDNIFCCCI